MPPVQPAANSRIPRRAAVRTEMAPDGSGRFGRLEPIAVNVGHVIEDNPCSVEANGHKTGGCCQLGTCGPLRSLADPETGQGICCGGE